MKRAFKIAAVATALSTLGIGAGVVMAEGKDGVAAHCRPFNRDVKALADKRLAKLHEELKLKAEQEGAWKEFSGAVSAQAGKAGEKMRAWRDSPRPATALERLERGQKALDEGRAALDELTTTTRRFYATLDKTQQARFDEATQRFGSHGFHRGASGV